MCSLPGRTPGTGYHILPEAGQDYTTHGGKITVIQFQRPITSFRSVFPNRAYDAHSWDEN